MVVTGMGRMLSSAPSSQVAHSDFRNGSFTSFPLSGVSGSLQERTFDSRRPGGEYIQGVPAGDAAALKMRPTTAPSASTLGIVLWRRKLWGSGTLSSAGCP